MAEVSHLHLLGRDDEEEDDRGENVFVPLDSLPYWSHDFDGFDLSTSDLDFSPSDFIISPLRQNPSRRSNVAVAATESITNQVSFVMDLFHQRVEQSSSIMERRRFGERGGDMFDLDLDLGLGLPGRGEIESSSFEVNLDLGLGLGFDGGIDCNDGEIDEVSGFMVADFGDDFSLSRRRSETVSDSGESSTLSGGPGFYLSGLHVSDIEFDSEDVGGIEEGFNDENVGGDDEDASLRACWAEFQLADESNDNGEGNEDFEWEEVDGGIDEREAMGMFFDGEVDDDDGEVDDDDASVLPGILTTEELLAERRVEELEWNILLNVHNLEANSELGHDGDGEPYDEYNYGEYEVFFGQFADNENASVGRPPASKLAVESLLSVAITQDDAEKNNALCAVCKDEINVGQMGKQLPCGHRYHGECIMPWLGIRNTCPVCRYELPTDDPEYERRRAGRTN